MLAQLKAYKNAAILFVIIVGFTSLATYVYLLNNRIDKLELLYSKCQTKYANEQRQSDLLRSALNDQSNKVEALRVSNMKARELLTELQNRPPEIRYKTITKIRKVKSNKCKDIQQSIDAIRKIDYSAL